MENGYYQGLGSTFYGDGLLKARLRFENGWASGAGDGFKYAANGKLVYRNYAGFGAERFDNGQLKFTGDFDGTRKCPRDQLRIRVFKKKGAVALDGAIKNSRGENGLLYWYYK